MIISINTLYFNLCIHDTFKRIFAQCHVYIHVYRFIKNHVINQKKYFLQISYNLFSNYISFILPTPCQWLYKGLKWKQTLLNLFINFSMILQTTYIYVIHIASQPTSHWACKHPWLILQTSFHQFSQEYLMIIYKPFCQFYTGGEPCTLQKYMYKRHFHQLISLKKPSSIGWWK